MPNVVTKEHVLAEIGRLADECGGQAPGQRRFEQETGISPGSWRGKYWRNWSDAVVAAGLAANEPPAKWERAALLEALLFLARQLRRFPTYGDIGVAHRQDPRFPSHNPIKKLGDQHVRLALMREYAAANDAYRDVLDLLPASKTDAMPEDSGTLTPNDPTDGFVYMLRLGKHYKIGRTESVPTRHRQVNMELPEKAALVHKIATDDTSGIEAYWHARFGSKRTNGEWFALDRSDVRAFKRRKFM
jgi:hypothetical protein